MLAVNILMSFSSAYFWASAKTFTSKTKRQANLNYQIMYYSFLFSGISESIDFIALMTSSLDTGPTEIWETGIFWPFKY